jgi:outer membrane lipoprotein-sorting protein
MKLKLSVILLVLACAASTHAQTVDEIIAKYFANTGGIEKWKALEGVRMTAKVNQQGMEIPLDIIQLKDGRQSTKFTFQGKEINQGVYDGSTLWSTNFMNMKAEKSDAETTENFKLDIGEFPDPFLNYKQRGLKAELVGKETVEGTETFKVKLTKKPIKVDGKETDNVVYYFFDTENFVPLMIENEVKSGPNKGIIAQNKMSDYQEVKSSNPKLDGLLFPFSLMQGAKGQPAGQPLTISTIELNPKVDNAVFAFPAGN